SSSTGRQRPGRPSISASRGASSTSAKPLNSQCASTLANTRRGRGCDERTHCSSEPSSKSLRKSPSSESSTANSAATQTSPGERVCNNCVSGPTASGNRATTMAKKTSGFARSDGRRASRRISRDSNWVKTLLMPLASQVEFTVGGRLVLQAVVSGQHDHPAPLAVFGKMALELGHALFVQGREGLVQHP